MNFPISLAGLLPAISTLCGGLVVYKWKRDLHPWLSLSGGILLGVAFLDLLPESITTASEHGVSVIHILSATLISILFFHLIDKLFSFHAHHEHAHEELPEHCDNDTHRETHAYMRAGGFVIHSFLDGLAIGGGFAANFQLGVVVLIAVLLHDFSDGMSTVTILRHGLKSNAKSILPILILDALAPFLGSLVGLSLAPNPSIIATLLAFFAGMFIFLSLADLLPQAHAQSKNARQSALLTIIGILIVVFIRRFADV